MSSRTGVRNLAPILSLAAVSAAHGFEAIHFESPHVHPVDLSPNGSRLFVTNTSDHHLSVFDLTLAERPILEMEIPVGMEPVTVRARTDDEVWVVSHLSDAINIVDLTTGNVVHTLLPGDEPTDVVFAGTPLRAFVCVSQEDRIKIYDPDDLDASPIVVDLAMSDPRSLAVSLDESEVYVCALDSQNRTTILGTEDVISGGGPPPPSPPMDGGLPAAPDVGLIVRHDGTHWVDEAATTWDGFLPFVLLDHDVVRVDATGAVTGTWTDVGTTLFNIAMNPVTGRLYVSNHEARNEVRFEPNLRGDFLRNRVTRVDPGTGAVTPVHLNPHIDYSAPEGSAQERALSLAMPTDIAVADDGSEIYVAAFGSGMVGVLDPDGAVLRRIGVGNGPSGIAVDTPRNRLYIINRIASTVTVIDLADDSTDDVALGYDPSPDFIRNGRSVFYDAALSSGHGDASCAGCHTFTGMDNLAWDLGDPGGAFVPNGINGYHPMKGPMVTQALKGLPETTPFHWRGDRDELIDFNPAFVNLMGRSTELSATDFQTMEDFLFSIQYPPNPFQNLDGSLPDPISGPNPTDGFDDYVNGNLVGGIECVDCHTFPTGETDLVIPAQLLQDTQDFVIPQLRNMYEKTRFDRTAATNVRGFGYTKDGAVDDLVEFFQFPGFDFPGGDAQRADQAAFMLAFNFEAAAALGAQWTMDGTNQAAGLERVSTLLAVADAGDVGVIAKGRDDENAVRGWTYTGTESWISDRESDGILVTDDLLALAGPGSEVTFTAVLAGSEDRLGVDRDRDGFRDRDEIDAGSDPADPDSTPDGSVSAGTGSAVPALIVAPVVPNPTRGATVSVKYGIESAGEVRVLVHDVHGRLVRILDEGETDPGIRSVAWDLHDQRGRRVSPGRYFVQIVSRNGRRSRPVVVLD